MLNISIIYTRSTDNIHYHITSSRKYNKLTNYDSFDGMENYWISVVLNRYYSLNYFKNVAILI